LLINKDLTTFGKLSNHVAFWMDFVNWALDSEGYQEKLDSSDSEQAKQTNNSNSSFELLRN
jgi:hypothetical protein